MIVESLAATAVIFLLIVIVTQVAFIVVAHDTAQTVVSAAARRAARPGSDLHIEIARLEDELARIVPGAASVAAAIEVGGASITARATIRWVPPGPDLIPITLRPTSTAPVVVPP